MRVWGVYYRLKASGLKDWTGPCGIFAMSFRDKLDADIFTGRPLFFRTRKLAREEAGRKNEKSCNAVYKVEPFDLRWKRQR